MELQTEKSNNQEITMSNIAKILKEEIQRLARREIKDATTGLRKDNVKLKRTIGEHKRRIKELEKQNKKLSTEIEKQIPQPAAPVPDTEVQKARITAKMIKAIRKQLGITQKEFASLIGISLGSVASWELKKGRLQFRNIKAKDAIAQVKGLRKAEVQERLGKKPSVKKEQAVKKAKPDMKKIVKKGAGKKKSQPTMTETIIKIIARYKKGVSISKLKDMTGLDDRKVRNVLYFST
jgi:transcriptional regulator with XRE-family HTH domain